MSIRLILIAHGETSATRRGVFPGSERLDERGRKAAQAMATTLPKARTILSSPTLAARDTATALGFDAVVEPALEGLDVGSWAGRSVMEIGMVDAESATAWIDDPTFAGHGGESIEALITRVGAWLAAKREASGTIIAVTHAAILRAAILIALDAPALAFWRIDAAPLAVLTLSSDGRRWTLRELRQPEPTGSPAKSASD